MVDGFDVVGVERRTKQPSPILVKWMGWYMLLRRRRERPALSRRERAEWRERWMWPVWLNQCFSLTLMKLRKGVSFVLSFFVAQGLFVYLECFKEGTVA